MLHYSTVRQKHTLTNSPGSGTMLSMDKWILNVDRAGYAKCKALLREIGEGAEQLEPQVISDHFVPEQAVARREQRVRETLTELSSAEFAAEYLALPLPRPPIDVRLSVGPCHPYPLSPQRAERRCPWGLPK